MKGEKLKYPTQEELKELFDYDVKTGKLFWKVDRLPKKTKGKEAGGITIIHNITYRQVTINTIKYMVHRLIWIYNYEKIDENLVIDHIDHDGLNNRLTNLRLVTNEENLKNCVTTPRIKYLTKKTEKIPGICWDSKLKEYRVLYPFVGDKKIIGYFKDKDLAIEALDKAELEYLDNYFKP
jgi:hypothetical protein